MTSEKEKKLCLDLATHIVQVPVEGVELTVCLTHLGPVVTSRSQVPEKVVLVFAITPSARKQCYMNQPRHDRS